MGSCFRGDRPDGGNLGRVQQIGGGAGPGSFFWDNVRLTNTGGLNALIGNFEPIPEPTSLILASLAVPPIVAAIRRRRSAPAQPSTDL